MKSLYPGKCKSCGGPIAKGEEINYSKETGATHWQCPQGDLLDASDASALADKLGFE